MIYFRDTFKAFTLEQAKNIVLTGDSKNPFKFDQETKFLVNAISEHQLVKSTDTVLDFGCGMGRVSRELINKIGCDVVGVDFSESMIAIAKEYVKSDKFTTYQEYYEPESVDAALCILVLQHVEDPVYEIDNIITSLKRGGKLILVNESKRLVPVGKDRVGYVIWEDDKFDVFNYLESKLKKVNQLPYFNEDKSIFVYEKV